MKGSLLLPLVILVSRTYKKFMKFWFTPWLIPIKDQCMRLRKLENSRSEMHVFNSNLTKMMTTVCFSSAKKSSADSTTLMKVKNESKWLHIKKPWKDALN